MISPTKINPGTIINSIIILNIYNIYNIIYICLSKYSLLLPQQAAQQKPTRTHGDSREVLDTEIQQMWAGDLDLGQKTHPNGGLVLT